MDEGKKQVIAQQIAKFRAAPPCPKEERPAGQAFWWSNLGARDGDSTAAATSMHSAGRLPRTASEGAEHLSTTTAALRTKKGRFTIQHKPGSPQASSPGLPASSNVAIAAVSVNATAIAPPSLEALQQLIVRNPALFKTLTELERDEQGKISTNTLEHIRSALDVQTGAQLQPQQACNTADAPQVSRVTASSRSTDTRRVVAGACAAPRSSAVDHSTGASSSNKFYGLPAGELTHRLVAHQVEVPEQAAAPTAAAGHDHKAQTSKAAAQLVAASGAGALSKPDAAAAGATPVDAGSVAAPTTVAEEKPADPPAVRGSNLALSVAVDADCAAVSAAVGSAAADMHAAGCSGSVAAVSCPASSLVCSSPDASSAGAMMCSSPDMSAQTASALSSNVSSRRASLRMSLSIDVSQHEESSSSRSSESGSSSGAEDGSNEAGLDCAAANSSHVMLQQQGTMSGHSTSIFGYSVHPKPWEVDSGVPQGSEGAGAREHVASGSDHSVEDSNGRSVRAVAQRNSNKQQKPATPGFAFRTCVGIFSRSVHDSDGVEEEVRLAQPSAAHGKAQQVQGDDSNDGCEELEQQPEQRQQPNKHWHNKLSKRPPTPGVSLGKPVSIFSSSGAIISSSSADHLSYEMECWQSNKAAGATDDVQHDPEAEYGLEHELAATEKAHSAKQHWHHKLSKRPPTPGISIGKPVSIFSVSSGSSCEQQQASSKSSRAAPAPSDAVCEAAEPVDEADAVHNVVQFAEPNGQAREAKQRKRMKQQAHNVQEGCKPAVKHHWHHKLSQRPPTPGAALGKPISIFSDPGGHGIGAAQRASSGVSSSTSTSKAAATGFAVCSSSEDELHGCTSGDAPDPRQRLVSFKQDLEQWPQDHQRGKCQLHIGEADSGRLVHFHEELDVHTTAASNKKPGLSQHAPKQTSDSKTERQRQHWQLKLSKRPPTPAVGLGEPVSIFTDEACSTSTGNSRCRCSAVMAAASASGSYAGCCCAAGAAGTQEPTGDGKYAASNSDSDSGESAHVRFREPKPKVVFKQELLHFSDSPVPFKQTSRMKQPQQQQNPMQSKQQWGSKLLHPHPTPVGGFGLPGRSFRPDAGSGSVVHTGELLQHGHQVSALFDSEDKPAAAQSGALHFAVAAAAAAAGSKADSADSGAVAMAAVVSHASTKTTPKQQQQDAREAAPHSSSKRYWHKKLSKRPATPGVSLGKPVSVFSSNCSSTGPDATAEIAPSPAAHLATTESTEPTPPAAVLAAAAAGSQAKSVAAVLASRNPDLVVDLQKGAVLPCGNVTDEEHEGADMTSSDSAAGKGGCDGAATYQVVPAGKATGKAWASEQSKRPLTPGIGLKQPVSIVSCDEAVSQAQVVSCDEAVSQAQAVSCDEAVSQAQVVSCDEAVSQAQVVSCDGAVSQAQVVSRSSTAHVKSQVSADGACNDEACGEQLVEHSVLDVVFASAKQEAWAKKLVASQPATLAAAVATQHAVQFRRTESGIEGDTSCMYHAAAPKSAAQQVKAKSSTSFTDQPQEAKAVPANRPQQQLAKPSMDSGTEQQPTLDDAVDQQQLANCRGSLGADKVSEPKLARQQAQHQEHSVFFSRAQLVTEQAAAHEQQLAKRRVSFCDAQDVQANSCRAAPAVVPEPTQAGCMHQGHQRGADVVDLEASKQEQWLAKAAKYPGTPGLGLLKPHVSILVDNVLYDVTGEAVEAEEDGTSMAPPCSLAVAAKPVVSDSDVVITAATGSAHGDPAPAASPQLLQQQQQKDSSSAVGQDERSSDSAVTLIKPQGRVSLLQAMLQQNPDLALERQAQQERKMAKHPTTPGAGLGKHVSIFSDDSFCSMAEAEPDRVKDAANMAAVAEHGAAHSAAPASSSSSRMRSSGSNSVAATLLRHNPDLTLEQQAQQERKMSKHATTPGAVLGKPFNMFRDDEQKEERKESAAASPHAAASLVTNSSGRTSIQSALLLHNPDLALEQLSQQERKMSKHPTTPGAGLSKHRSIFSDDAAGDEHHSAAGAAAKSNCTTAAPVSSSCGSGRTSVQSELLLHNPDLALEQQAQRQRKMSKHATTPGAALAKHFSIFKDDSDEGEADADKAGDHVGKPTAPAGPAKGLPPVSQQQQHQQLKLVNGISSPAAVQAALVRHNPDIALEQQSQQECKMGKCPTTPGAAWGKPFNMFRSESDESDGDISSSSSPANSPGRPIPDVTSRLPSDTMHSSSSSSSLGSGSSPVQATSPDMMAAGMYDSSSTAAPAAARGTPGSINPERRRRTNTSTLRRSSNSTDSDPSPLRRNSSAGDLDPSRLSPLGRGLTRSASAQAELVLSVKAHSLPSSSSSKAAHCPFADISTRDSREVGQLASSSDKLPVFPLGLVEPSSAHNNPATKAASSSSPLFRASNGGITASGSFSNNNGSCSPLRHASSVNDPLPARSSPLRRDSACAGTPGSGLISRRSSLGWEKQDMPQSKWDSS